MVHETIDIFNVNDFERITKGIKVAQCMRIKSSQALDSENVVSNLEDLVVSTSLCCSFCNTAFENKDQQRLHYKLDWHRFNLKQNLRGLKSISEDNFNLMTYKENSSSTSGSESDSESEDSNVCNTDVSSNKCVKNSDLNNSDISASCSTKSKRTNRKSKSIDDKSDSSEEDFIEDGLEDVNNDDHLSASATRHTKVFFENEEGNIFSIYRCLLHNKKKVPEDDSEIITQALKSGKKSFWTILMVGGGHFAGAVFSDGNTLVHKTFHSYTVRAKQGSVQSSQDNRNSSNHPKSAGASLRRYNELALIQHIQQILESWSSYILNSSLILYRAVGPSNRSVLFGGRNAPLDKTDVRLRPIPFPTRKATFKEVKRVYNILSSVEIYGSASNFVKCFPISPLQLIRKKESTPNSADLTNITIASETHDSKNVAINDDVKEIMLEKQPKNIRSNIDRAKLRKLPQRPLPDIVAKLAQSTSESEHEDSIMARYKEINLISTNEQIDFASHLKIFDHTPSRGAKKKCQRKQKFIKDLKNENNEELIVMKLQLWTACQTGDLKLFLSSLEMLFSEVEKSNRLLKYSNLQSKTDSSNLVSKQDVIDIINDSDINGDTMLHIAASGNYSNIVWILLDLGSNLSKKNKKLQTPYNVATSKKMRTIFRQFMSKNPYKYNYNKILL